LKYDYNMWSLNEWSHCMLWLGVLKIVIAMEHEYDFRVGLSYANCLRNDMLNCLCFYKESMC